MTLHSSTLKTLFGMILVFSIISTTQAGDDRTQSVLRAQKLIDKEILDLPMYLRFHPDERWRALALDALDDGRIDAAKTYLRRAARYADKAAQAIYAELLWTGEGGSRDRALAYAWMDLAAERGTIAFLLKREQYWSALDAAERERAQLVGAEVYAEYGDEVTVPRLELELRRGRNSMTGSHIGATSSNLIDFRSLSDAGFTQSEGKRRGRITHFWDKRYWQPEAYWQWQDERLNQLYTGTVTVEPLVPVTADE